MYGIKRGSTILCRFVRVDDDRYQFREADRVKHPVMIESSTEIDNLLQQCMFSFNLYDLVVFEFTKEQEAEFIIKKLQGL